ncbi:hypothetical protein B0T17DRAFT_511307 [Bombardia bombarda]|uniref:HTH La-type RNA-binding domain-containing protein n=1 Tax=Bombardia bombarda TaxID=252184 RepID=A0AA39U7T0_9PEZI|nr:hypothetical protein B0T17DRAFT_511307 [Bombardia bombarda]
MSATTFSYAQAAMGQTVSLSSSQLSSSSAPPSTSSQAKDDVPTGSTSVTAPSVASNDGETLKTIQPDAEVASGKQDPEVASVTGSAPSAVSSAEQSTTTTSRESDGTSVDSQQHFEDKASRSTSRTSRSNDGADNRKPRKGKKGRQNEKDTQHTYSVGNLEEAVPVFFEAPVPSVNVWMKRIEAKQAAKSKIVPATAPGTESNGSPTNGDMEKSSATDVLDAQVETPNGVNGDKAHKRSPESPRGVDQGQRRSGPRGSRANDKDENASGALPPVADSSSWPDPKSAAETDGTVPKSQDKADRSDKDAQEDGPTKKNKWEKLPFEPTVVFNTPIPARGAKPRGGARGGRDSGSTRGNHANAANSQNASAPGPTHDRAASVSGPVVSKNGVSRPVEGSITTRTASQAANPHPTKRASFDGTEDIWKLSVSGNTEQVSGIDTSVPSTSTNKKTHAAREGQNDVSANTESVPVLPRSLFHQRTNGLHPRASEFVKDAAHSAVNGQQYPVREGRGRGGYRSRGGHNNASNSNVHQTPYGQNGQYHVHALFQSRQNSAAHGPPYGSQYPTPFNQQSRGRNNKWAGQGSGRNGSNGAAFAPKMPQVNDFPTAQYHTGFHWPAAVDPLVHVAKNQVEYYFSIDNLCKDRWLRQHMDSQGFAHFNFVTGFRRMQELAKGDLDMIRTACSLSDSIEFVIGDDQVQRLRSREHWAAFVYPSYERSEKFRDDHGPANWTPYPRQGAQMPYTTSPIAQPGYSVTSPVYHATYMNGPNGVHYNPSVNVVDRKPNGHHYAPETRLSAAVPAFNPPVAPFVGEGTANAEAVVAAQSVAKESELESADATVPGEVNGPTADAHTRVGAQGPIDSSTNMKILYQLWARSQFKGFNAKVFGRPEIPYQVYEKHLSRVSPPFQEAIQADRTLALKMEQRLEAIARSPIILGSANGYYPVLADTTIMSLFSVGVFIERPDMVAILIMAGEMFVMYRRSSIQIAPSRSSLSLSVYDDNIVQVAFIYSSRWYGQG